MDVTDTHPTPLECHLSLRETVDRHTADRLRTIRARALELPDHPRVADVTVEEWPRKVAVDGPGPTDEPVRETLESYIEWAYEADVGLYPAFQTRTCYSWDTDERYTALSLPLASLAVRHQGELLAVFPHFDGDEHKSVLDGLAAIDRGDLAPEPDDEPVATPAD